MAFKEIIEPQTESPFDWIGRQISSGAKLFGRSIESSMRQAGQQAAEEAAITQAPYAEAGQAIESFLNKLFGEPTKQQRPQETILPLSQRLAAAQSLNLPGQPSVFQIEPARNWIEEAIQGSIAAAPEALLYGPSLRGLIPMATGQFARAGIKRLGGGELAQTGGQLITELGTSRFAQPTIEKTLRGYGSAEAERAKAIAPKQVKVAPEMNEAVKFADKEIRTSSTKAKKGEILELQKSVGNLVAGNKTDPLELWDIQKDMYDEYPYLSNKAKPVSTKYTKAIGQTLKNSGLEHPEFWNRIDASKQVKAYNNMQTAIGWAIDNVFSQLPLKHPSLKAIQKIGREPLGWLERQFVEKPISLIFNLHPKVREYYIKMATAAAEQNQGNFIKYASAFTNEVETTKDKEKGRFKEVLD